MIRPLLAGTLLAMPLMLAAGAASAQSGHEHHHHPEPAKPAVQEPPKQADPHAGHAGHAGHSVQPADPHAGHTMAPANDPHAGHAMPAADPHAGHRMPAADPHAGHVMPRVDPPLAGPSPAAFSGPAHAADRYFDPADMQASRDLIRYENGDMPFSGLFIDRLEYSVGEGRDYGAWEVQGWSGGDIHRFWWKTDGAFDTSDSVDEAGLELLYSRAVAPFWDVQAGIRQDYARHGADPTSVVLAVQGVAPYWFETGASLYVSHRGDVTAELEAEYDQRLTQKLILQPSIGVTLSAQDIAEREIGSGLSSLHAGLRLRYELKKELAPYVGVEWSQAFGRTRDWREAAGGEGSEARLVIGLKAWL